MTTKTFKLLTEEDVPQIDDAQIDVGPDHDLQDIQSALSKVWSIVSPQGIGFRDSNGRELSDIDAINACGSVIKVDIDGHPVKYPNGPQGLPLVGTYLETFPDHLGNHQRMFEQYGAVIKTTDYGRVIYQTNDPAIASIVLDESEFFTKLINDDHPLAGIKEQSAGLFLADTDSPSWRRAHKFLTPAFTPKAIRHYTPIFNTTIEKAFHVFDELDEKGEAFNVYPFMLRLGSQAIGKFMFDADFHHWDTVDTDLNPIVKLIAQNLTLNKKVSSRGSWYAHLPFGDPKHLKDTKVALAKIMRESAANVAATSGEDLPLQEAAQKASCIVDYINRATDTDGQKVPQEMVVPLLSVAAGAGFATTSSLLSWLLFSCVTYPEWQEKLLQEYIDHGINADTQVDWDLIQSMPNQVNFIKETQRMHNPSYQPARTARKDLILPGGFYVPKDKIVIAAIHHIHNNPDVWDDPSKFNPERFSEKDMSQRPKGSYIPFASGTRQCIGFNFALTEVKTFLPRLLYRYKFERVSDDAIEYDPEFQLIRPMNLYVRAVRRVEWPNPTIQKAANVVENGH